MESILNTELLVLHLYLGSSTDFNNSYAAGELSQTLLELLLIKVGGSVSNLLLNLLDTGRDCTLFTHTINNSSIFLGGMYLTGTTKILDSYAVQLTAQLLRNQLTTGEDCNILQHSLAAITKARSLNSQSLEGTTELIYNDGSQSLTIQILSDDNQFLAHLNNLLKNWEYIVNGGNLLISNEDIRIVHYSFHLISISNHVRGDVATIELHTLYNGKAGLHTLGLLNGDNTFLANLLHSVSNILTDFLISRGYSCNLCNCLLGLYWLRNLLKLSYQSLNCLFNTLLQNHRVRTGSYVTHTLMNHGLSQKSCSGSTITGNIVGLGSNLTNQLGTHILKRIIQLNVTGNGNTIISNGRCTKLLIKNYVTTLWTKGNLYCICQCVNALFQSTTSFFIK